MFFRSEGLLIFDPLTGTANAMGAGIMLLNFVGSQNKSHGDRRTAGDFWGTAG